MHDRTGNEFHEMLSIAKRNEKSHVEKPADEIA